MVLRHICDRNTDSVCPSGQKKSWEPIFAPEFITIILKCSVQVQLWPCLVFIFLPHIFTTHLKFIWTLIGCHAGANLHKIDWSRLCCAAPCSHAECHKHWKWSAVCDVALGVNAPWVLPREFGPGARVWLYISGHNIHDVTAVTKGNIWCTWTICLQPYMLTSFWRVFPKYHAVSVNLCVHQKLNVMCLCPHEKQWKIHHRPVVDALRGEVKMEHKKMHIGCQETFRY